MSYFSVLKFINDDFRSVERTFENQELAECYACHLASKESSDYIAFEVHESGSDARTFDAVGGKQYELKDGVRLISKGEWMDVIRDYNIISPAPVPILQAETELVTRGLTFRGQLLFCPELIESVKGPNA